MAEQLHHHHIVLPFRPAVVEPRNSMVHAVVIVGQVAQNFGLIEELRTFGTLGLKLDCHLRVVFDMHGQVDLPEGSGSQFLVQLILFGDYAIHFVYYQSISFL